MTVGLETGQNFYTANGNTVFFEITFTLDEDSGVVVLVDTVVATNYQLQLNGILFDSPPAAGSIVSISRNTELNQLRDFYPFEAFPADKTEDAMDKLIRLKQEAGFRRNMNLSVIRDDRSVTLLNDKGTDAYIPLWNHTLDEAGMFAGVLTSKAPGDGGFDDNNSFVWFEKNIPDPVEPFTTVLSSPNLAGYWTTAMNFGGPSNTPPFSRTHPLAGWSTTNFTQFACWKWDTFDPGFIWNAQPFSLEATHEDSRFFIGWEYRDDNHDPIAAGTFELGDLSSGTGLGDIGDWFVVMFSVENLDVPDPNRFKAWVVNLSRGQESDFSTTGGFDNDNDTGVLGWPYGTEMTQDSRYSDLNVIIGDVSGNFAFSGYISSRGYNDTFLDFDIEANRRLICELDGLSDHGQGGVTVFGERAMYYTYGHSSDQTGWVNIGDPFSRGQVIYAGDLNQAPYDFIPAPQPQGDWEYDTMELADASGDAWLDGQTIFVRQGMAEMTYRTALAVDGHNGLRHSIPFNDRVTYANNVVLDSEPEGSDPNTWNATDNSVGVEGVDYELDVFSGRARLRKLTASAQVILAANTSMVPGDEVTFSIMNRCTANFPDGFNGTFWYLGSGDGTTNQFWALAAWDTFQVPNPPARTWAVQYEDGGGAAYGNTNAPWEGSTEERFWMYLKGSTVAIWNDQGPMLMLELPRPGGNGLLWNLQIGTPGDADLSEFLVGNWLMGNLS